MASIGDVKATLTLDTSKFVAGINTARKTTDSLRSTLGSVTSSIFNLKNAMVGAIGALGINDIKNTAIQFESLQNAMNAASGGAKEGAASMAFVRSESERLGLNLTSTSESFKSFLGAARNTKLTSDEIRNVFTSVSEASAVMGLSAEQSSGAFMALQQMLSKGTVQAEELRGQLGERIPGAFNIAAESMGVTTRELGKMLEMGQVVAEDFVPKFAKTLQNKFAKDVPAAARSARAEMERFGNSITELKLVIADSGLLAFITQLAKVSTIGFKALGKTIKEELSDSMKDAKKSTEDYVNVLIRSVDLGGRAIGYLADAWFGVKLIVASIEIAYRSLRVVTTTIAEAMVSSIESAINGIIAGINHLIDAANELGLGFKNIGEFSFGSDIEKESILAKKALADAQASFIELASSPKPSKDIKAFTEKFKSNIKKVQDEAKKAEEAIKNIAPSTAIAAAPVFTFNTQAFEDSLKTGVQSALTKGITEALTGKFDFKTFAQQMTNAVASAAAAGIVQGMALSTGGALALAGGAALLGGMFGGSDKKQKVSLDELADRKFQSLIDAITNNTDAQLAQARGQTGSEQVRTAEDIKGEIDRLRLRNEEIQSQLDYMYTQQVSFGGRTDGSTLAKLVAALKEQDINIETITKLETEYSKALNENIDSLASFVSEASKAAIAQKTLSTVIAGNTILQNAGISSNEDFVKALRKAGAQQEKNNQLIAQGIEIEKPLSDIQNELLRIAGNTPDAIQLVIDSFTDMGDVLSRMESSLNNVTMAFASVGEMSRNTQSVIDTITAGMKAPAEAVGFLETRRKQELDELKTARENLASLTPGTETYLQQLQKVQQENQDFLQASQQTAEAIKSTFGSSDVGQTMTSGVLADLQSQQENNFTLEQQLMNDQVSLLIKIEENTRPSSKAAPTTEGLTDEQIALVLKSLIEKYSTQEAFD